MSKIYHGRVIVNNEKHPRWNWTIDINENYISTATQHHRRYSIQHIQPLLKLILHDELDVDGAVVEMNYENN